LNFKNNKVIKINTNNLGGGVNKMKFWNGTEWKNVEVNVKTN